MRALGVGKTQKVETYLYVLTSTASKRQSSHHKTSPHLLRFAFLSSIKLYRIIHPSSLITTRSTAENAVITFSKTVRLFHSPGTRSRGERRE